MRGGSFLCSKPKGRDFRCYLVIFESFLFISSIYHSKIWGVFQSPSWIMLVLVCLGCYGCLKTWKWPLVWVHVVKGWKCFILLFWMRPISIFNFFLEHFRGIWNLSIFFLDFSEHSFYLFQFIFLFSQIYQFRFFNFS